MKDFNEYIKGAGYEVFYISDEGVVYKCKEGQPKQEVEKSLLDISMVNGKVLVVPEAQINILKELKTFRSNMNDTIKDSVDIAGFYLKYDMIDEECYELLIQD